MLGFQLSLSFSFVGKVGRVSFLFARTKQKQTTINKHGVWWTEGGSGVSGIASSSLGDRKKGYPKRQALWELTLALGRFPFDFEFFLRILVFFHRF